MTSCVRLSESQNRYYDMRIFSRLLIGLMGDCDMSYCSERELSTGHAMRSRRDSRWYVEFACPVHGIAAKWRAADAPIVSKVVGDLGTLGNERL